MKHRFAPALLAAVSAATLSLSAQDPLSQVRDYRRQHAAEILEGFAELLAIPNVSSDSANIQRNADYIAAEFRKRGAEMRLLELDGIAPVIYGELRARGAERTLVVYVHYDGQPVDATQWTQPPFQPALYSAAIEDGGQPVPWPKPGEPVDPEWRIYGRSAGDDKAPIPAILGALDALRSSGIALTSNIKFFFEGEEEVGSTNLGRYLEKYKDLLQGDIWLFCDGPVHQSRTPQLVFGVRGVIGMTITVYGANRYLHSGHYGNWAPNPALMLAQLLAGMKDEDGNVLVEGYYDSVEPLSAADRAALKAVPDYDSQLRRELGLAATENRNQPYLERLALPSLNIRGLASATAGANARNVVPPEATASIDLRLVKGNDPVHMVDLVEAHIRKQGYHIVRETPDLQTRLKYAKIAMVARGSGYPAARTSMDLPLAGEIARAARRAADGKLILVPTLGGSLPLYLFTDTLRQPVLIVPIANHDDNQHAPNENLRLANLWYGIDLMSEVFTMPKGSVAGD